MKFCDGMSAYAMNYLRYIDHRRFSIDFLVLNNKIDFEDELKRYKSNVYVMPNPIKNLFSFLNKANKFFSEHREYDIIHCHVANQGAFYLIFARLYGNKVRILHSHVTKSSDKLLNKLRNDVLAPLARVNANVYAACSDDARKHLFGKKKAYIINNAIEIDKFRFSDSARTNFRKLWAVNDKTVIGCVGRYVNQKNPLFTLDIFYRISQSMSDTVLLLIGEGELEGELRKKVKEYNIEDKVIFVPPSENVAQYYSAMDCFLLPSVYEGLGIVYIEAQASGLPTFASDVVPKETRVSDLITYIGLGESVDIWADSICDRLKNSLSRECPYDELTVAGFNIISQVKRLEQLYEVLTLKREAGKCCENL